MNDVQNPIVVSDTEEDDVNQGDSGAASHKEGTSNPRPLKRARTSLNPWSSSPSNAPMDTIRAAALKRSQDDNARIQKENERLRKDLSEERQISAQTRQTQKEVATLKETIAKMQTETTIVSQQHYDAQNELKKQIEQLHADLSVKESALLDLDATKMKLKHANADISKKKLELEQTQSALTGAESEKALSQEKAKELEGEIAQLRPKIAGLEKELESAKARIESADAKIAERQEHTNNCVLVQQTPEFLEHARGVLQKIEERHQKRDKERVWPLEGLL